MKKFLSLFLSIITLINVNVFCVSNAFADSNSKVSNIEIIQGITKNRYEIGTKKYGNSITIKFKVTYSNNKFGDIPKVESSNKSVCKSNYVDVYKTGKTYVYYKTDMDLKNLGTTKIIIKCKGVSKSVGTIKVTDWYRPCIKNVKYSYPKINGNKTTSWKGVKNYIKANKTNFVGLKTDNNEHILKKKINNVTYKIHLGITTNKALKNKAYKNLENSGLLDNKKIYYDNFSLKKNSFCFVYHKHGKKNTNLYYTQVWNSGNITYDGKKIRVYCLGGEGTPIPKSYFGVKEYMPDGHQYGC